MECWIFNVLQCPFSVTILSCRKGATNCTLFEESQISENGSCFLAFVLVSLLFPACFFLARTDCLSLANLNGHRPLIMSPELFCMLSVLGSCKVAALILEGIKLSISLTHATNPKLAECSIKEMSQNCAVNILKSCYLSACSAQVFSSS
jgi:hypothetical protein